MKASSCSNGQCGVVLLLILSLGGCRGSYLFQTSIPYVMTSGGHGINATRLAWKLLTEDELHPLDCVEQSLSQTCELNYCSGGVGPYSTLTEKGDFSFDAMMMDGTSKEVGAVGNLKHVRAAISVARAVMKYTTHSFITGDDATSFAEEMGFPVEDLRTEETEQEWEDWKDNSCQPNYRQNVSLDPQENCGPYTPVDSEKKDSRTHSADSKGRSSDDGPQDTIGQIIVDSEENVVVGTTTNGLQFKIPGRVGDSPVPGAGGYAWSGAGAATATGNGDILIRFLTSFDIVTQMENGQRPDVALIAAANRVIASYPEAGFTLYAGNAQAAVCTGATSSFSVQSDEMEATLFQIDCAESIIPPDDDDVAAGATDKQD